MTDVHVNLVVIAVSIVIFTTVVIVVIIPLNISCLVDTVAVMCSSAQHQLSKQLMHLYNREWAN